MGKKLRTRTYEEDSNCTDQSTTTYKTTKPVRLRPRTSRTSRRCTNLNKKRVLAQPAVTIVIEKAKLLKVPVP